MMLKDLKLAQEARDEDRRRDTARCRGGRALQLFVAGRGGTDFSGIIRSCAGLEFRGQGRKPLPLVSGADFYSCRQVNRR